MISTGALAALLRGKRDDEMVYVTVYRGTKPADKFGGRIIDDMIWGDGIFGTVIIEKEDGMRVKDVPVYLITGVELRPFRCYHDLTSVYRPPETKPAQRSACQGCTCKAQGRPCRLLGQPPGKE